LYGGFAGTESARSERDWVRNETVLDGGSTGTVVTIRGGYRDRGVDGFTIQNGRSEYGGGVDCYDSSPLISNNRITGNTALSKGGGISCEYRSSPVLTNNTVTKNFAQYGGGMFCSSYSAPVITNNTIVDNTAGGGGGLYCDSSYSLPVVSNNIVAFNSSGIYDGEAELRNNDVYNPGGYDYGAISPGHTDISADPLFADRSSGDYHLMRGSPCVNAGWNDAPKLPPEDSDGEPRVMGEYVDIGADEFDVGTTPPGGSITGKVTLQGCSDHSARITFEIRQPDSSRIVANGTNDEDPSSSGTQITTGSDGSYEIRGVPPGVYDLTAKGRKWLRQKQTNIIVVDGNTTQVFFDSLKGGDADNNNSVNNLDLDILKASYGKSSGQFKYNDAADFDKSKSVNIIDLNILKNNYGQPGQ
jgi:parallel beta-helix repeat protein